METDKERLAVLETQLDNIISLVKEVNNEVKNQPSREEFNLYIESDRQSNCHFEKRIKDLEKGQTNLAVKVAGATASLSILIPLIKWILTKV